MKLFKIVFSIAFAFSSVSFAQTALPPQPMNNCGTSNGFRDNAYSSCYQNYQREMNEWRNKTAAINNINAGTYSGTSSTGVKPPNQPNYSQCNRVDDNTGASSQDASCIQSLQNDYQRQLASYNEIKRQEDIAKQQAAIAQKQYASAKAAAEAAQRANDEAQKNYERRQMLSNVRSLVLTGAGIACASSVACSPKAPAIFIAASAFAMFAGMAGQAATNHAATENTSCLLANKLSTNPADCGPAPTPFDPSAFPNNTQPPISSMIDKDGKCIATPSVCTDIQNNLPPGTSLKDAAKAIAQFASAKPPFKVNKDGSIIHNDGKKYDANMLNSEADMIAAGMTPEMAKSLSAQMKSNSEIAKALNAKDALSVENLAESLDGDANGAGKSALAGSGNGNGDNTGLDIDAGGKKRSLAAAEGLVKDFNGEAIGVAGDDIWKMMNRRYRLKETQDSFMKTKP